MDMDLGNVAYNEDAILNLGADYPESSNMKAEVLLFELEPEDGQNQSWEEDSLTKRQLEARMIAEKIIEMKKTLQITDKKTGELRAVKNSDIVILLRRYAPYRTNPSAALPSYPK